MDFIKRNKLICIFISIIILSAVGYGILYINEEKNKITFETPVEVIEKKEEIVVKNRIFVDIGGEVLYPGLYELDEGSRIYDVITLAGGVTEEASLDDVNLAYILSDGIKVTIPKRDKNAKNTKKPVIYTGASNIGESYVNINTATIEELCKLDGIGESIAQKIINYRESKGKFKAKEELKNVPGIGESKYNLLKNDITI